MFDGDYPVWSASLALRFHSVDGRSVCAARHSGPLRLQKPLYPEGPKPCHAIVIHPPGGIAGGDVLEVAIDVQRGAHALITTPGAAKWYKANGRTATQKGRLEVAGTLEWLPQESIVFDASNARSSIDIELAGDATIIGWDIVALGRRAAGERFERGCFAQTIRLSRRGGPQWIERPPPRAPDSLLDSPVGLAGHTVFGCLWASGPAAARCELDDLRAQLNMGGVATPITPLGDDLLGAPAVGGG